MYRVLFLFFFLPLFSFAQNKPGTQLRIKKALGAIHIDGRLDEEDWKQADVAKDWYLNYPVDSTLAPMQSEARLTFNEHFLYISFVCFDDSTRDIINSLRRDFDYERNDNIGVNIGPYNDRLNGFFFAMTPAGVQMEGTISGGGASDDSWNVYWDNKWYSKVVRYKDRWIGELAIPFKSFRYKSDLKEWNISFDRLDKKRNHKSSWIHTPIQFPTGTFAYSGQLVWEDPIPPAHTNISFIPFVAGKSATQNESDPKTNEMQMGFDAKVSVTPSLNLDLTYNPDFSQVEVDQQVINLTRFEFQFPERRQFFLENSDLFDRAGFPETRIFFSRRIGLVKDSSGLYRRVPILYGARLSGSLNKNWRISVLNMQTREKLTVGLPSQNYTAATVQRNFWHQSNFSVTYVGKETVGVKAADSIKYFHESVFQTVSQNGTTYKKRNCYNRAISTDLELLSKDNKWQYSAFYARTFDDFEPRQTSSGGSYLQYSVRKFNASGGFSLVGKNFNAETGYVPSHGVYPGQINYFANANYKFYPKNSAVIIMGPFFSAGHTYIHGSNYLTDRSYEAGYFFNFKNTSRLVMFGDYIYQRLTSSFNPIDGEKFTSFLTGQDYTWQNFTIRYISNSRQIVNYVLASTYGGFYNGTNLNINGQLNVRYQPHGNISMRFDYNDIHLAKNYGHEQLFLIGPRVDLTFTDKIFLTTYVQYNKLLDNMNLNARFQWRYKPASDFFIVYTENYLPDNLTSKNRALVFKLTYWLNI